MHAGCQQRPVPLQFAGQRGEFRPGALGGGEVGGGERMLLYGDEVQAPAALRVVAPGLPGGEEVEPEAEAGFEDDETVAVAPARRQVVAAEEDVARLRRPAVGGVIDVAVGGGKRGAVGGEFETGGLQRHGPILPRCTARIAVPAGLAADWRLQTRAAGS